MCKKGFRHTEETKRKMSESSKGPRPNARGQVPWNKGRTGVYSKEVIEKMRESATGRAASEDTKQKMSQTRTGKHHSDETRKRMSESRMGIPPWNKGLCGPESSNWKGGITPEHDKIRQSPEMETWRKFVFERDDYTCQECLEHGGELRAHHSKSFSEYPHLRFQTWNGITLCKKCHQLYHGGIG